MNRICIDSRKSILESAEVDLLTPELEEAKMHLKECKECQFFFAQQDEIKKFIKKNLTVAKALPSVREKIFNSISERKEKKHLTYKHKILFSKNPSRFWWAAAVIAALIISLLFLIPFNTNKSKITTTDVSEISGHQLTEALIDDYINYRLSEQPVEYATNNPRDLNNWISRKMDFNARFPSIDELQLVGGRACHLFQRRVALAFYHKPDQWVSLFIFKDYQVISQVP